MIIYTVYDAGEDEHFAFPTKAAAIACAKECSRGTEVHKLETGPITRQFLCALYKREGYARDGTLLVFTSRDNR